MMSFSIVLWGKHWNPTGKSSKIRIQSKWAVLTSTTPQNSKKSNFSKSLLDNEPARTSTKQNFNKSSITNRITNKVSKILKTTGRACRIYIKQIMIKKPNFELFTTMAWKRPRAKISIFHPIRQKKAQLQKSNVGKAWTKFWV